MSIVQTLLEQVESEVQGAGHGGPVLSVHLVIGRLSGVHVDAIRFAFELLAPDSIARDAELVVDEPRAVLCCHACCFEREIEELHARCTRCGSPDVTIRGGKELLLQSIELED
ncbi:MAG: hydrogenase maturation nickel metallochaperone HypA [Planctomycetota bacterium]